MQVIHARVFKFDEAVCSFMDEFGKITAEVYGPISHCGSHPERYIVIFVNPEDDVDMHIVDSSPAYYFAWLLDERKWFIHNGHEAIQKICGWEGETLESIAADNEIRTWEEGNLLLGETVDVSCANCDSIVARKNSIPMESGGRWCFACIDKRNNANFN